LENKLKLNEIAKAYGVSRSAIEKWHPTKRQKAIRLLSAGVNPQIMELVGEVQRLCYAASMVTGHAIKLDIYICRPADGGHFTAYGFDDAGDYIGICERLEVSVKNLQLAITKIEGIIYGVQAVEEL
jgi:hypothetical protein